MKLRYVIGGAIALTTAISVFGAVIGPAWRPRELTHMVAPSTPETGVTADNSLPVGSFDVNRQVIDVDLGEVTVPAIVRSPLGVEGDLSAVVFMHGAGTHGLEGFQEQAEALASAGIVTVVPAKRMDTYTTAYRDYGAMAADYGRSVAMAAELPGVMSVGIYAESEGAYSAPILATSAVPVDFVILVSPPVVPARQQSAFATDNYLRMVGVPNALFRTIPRALGAQIPFGWMRYADFDPQPYQQRMVQPTFLAFGTGDASMPLVQGTEQLGDDLAVAGNYQLTTRFYAGANHGIKLGPEGERVLDAGFAQGLADWIRGLVGTADEEPLVAGVQPEQLYRADPLPHVRWFLSGNALVATHAGALALLAGGAATAGVLWLARRGRRGTETDLVARIPRPVAITLGAAGAGALLTWATFGIYIKRVADLAFNYGTDPVWTFGVYAGQQVVALAAATGLAAALVVGHLNRADVRGSNRFVFVTTAGGSFALLVLAAYWGGFPDITGGFGI